MAKTATFKIYGAIGEPIPDFFGFGDDDSTVSSKMVSEFIEANQDADEYVIRINSPGGDVQEGWNIHDLLTTSGKKITTIGEGKIYSIATVIFLAGSVRKMMKNADGLIHNPYFPEYSLPGAYESTDLKHLADELAQEEAKILEFYVEKTGQSSDKLADYMKNETKLSADDMVSLGFATEIVEPVVAFAYIKQIKIDKMANDNDKKNFLERFNAAVAAFSRITGTGAKNMTKTDANGKTFEVEKESGDLAVGDVASPDGTFEMENGDVIVINGGKIESITPKANENDDMDAANAKITQLTNELNALKTEKATADKELETLRALKASNETAIAGFKASEKEMTDLISELRILKNEWKPENRSGFNAGGQKIDGIDMNRVREIVDKNKSKKKQ